jgi:hypothetical protein
MQKKSFLSKLLQANVFSQACDAILDASEFEKLNCFLKLSKKINHYY